MMVRDARPEDRASWEALWAAYLVFYQVDLPDHVTATNWTRALDPAQPIAIRLAERNGQIVGFAVSVLHPSTWATSLTCYLEDLFVDPTVRGRGVGRALIDDLVAQGRAKGWDHVYWVTEHDNARARALYDSYALADGYVRYRLGL